MKTLYLLFTLGLIVIFSQPVKVTNCPDYKEPPNRGDCRQ